MVNVVLVGGTGSVGRHILDGIYNCGNHEITLFTRKPSDLEQQYPGVKVKVVDYTDYSSLVEHLRGVEAVVSVINVVSAAEAGAMAHENLIRASIEAGVKRFAPSEWAGVSSKMYEAKLKTRKLLEDLNKDKKVLEYTYFIPGVIMDYLAHPYTTSQHVRTFAGAVSIEECKAVINPGEYLMAMTTCEDMGRVVAAALDLELGTWPTIGGFYGGKATLKEIVAIGEKVRGRPFDVYNVTDEDVAAMNFPWYPPLFDHPMIPPDKKDFAARRAISKILTELAGGGFDVPDAFNQLLPDLKLTSIEDLITATWAGRTLPTA